MSNAFFYDLLSSIAERGRSVLKIKPWPKDGENRADLLVETCRALVAGRGEASGVALAAEILRRYRALDPSDHAAFFRALADEFGPDRERVMTAIANFGPTPTRPRRAISTTPPSRAAMTCSGGSIARRAAPRRWSRCAPTCWR